MTGTLPIQLVPAEKVKQFPQSPGVYLMKDTAGVVIYIGKAKNLRDRAGSYFRKAAESDNRINQWVDKIADIDYIETGSEVDAVLLEARLIKDISPKYNKDLKDGRILPYLQIRTREPYPKVEITRQPKEYGTKLYGPYTNSYALKFALIALQKVFKFRTCTLKISLHDERWRWYRPCVLYSIHQCAGPCNFRITPQEYRKNIRNLCSILAGHKTQLLKKLQQEMESLAADKRYEVAAEIRDQIRNLQTLDKHGNAADKDLQPEAFVVDPRTGVLALQKVLKIKYKPRVIEGIDIAHVQGTDMVASMVKFMDGMPFKPGYRRYRIKTVNGVNDYACMQEVITRRFSHEYSEDAPPDILLVDGGKGQLNAVLDALKDLPLQPKLVMALAKQEEEVFVPEQDHPLKLPRRNPALRLLQSIRDESHRFAQHYHHILRSRHIE